MPNQTTVTLTNGVPTAPSGTVSTIDALMADGGQATLGAQADAVVAAGAAGTIGAKLRAISRDLVANIVLAAGANIIGLLKISDGTNTAAVKAASTAPIATDPALVTSLSPNSPGIIATGTQAVPSAAYLSSVVAGDVAAAAPDSGNPVKMGGVGHTANPTAVTDGQRVNAMFDKVGRQAHVPHAIRDLVADQTTSITGSTSATTIVTADASNQLDLVGLILANTSASGTEVQLLNDDGTTLRATFYVPPTDTRGIVFPVPFKQTAVNKTWKMITVTSISSLKVTAQFVKNI